MMVLVRFFTQGNRVGLGVAVRALQEGLLSTLESCFVELPLELNGRQCKCSLL